MFTFGFTNYIDMIYLTACNRGATMYAKLTDEEYFARPELNQSTIKNILKMTPESFSWHVNNKTEKTQAMHFGSMLHTYVLEPESIFNKRYIRIDVSELKTKYKNYKASKEYKDIVAKLKHDNPDAELIDNSELAEVLEASKSIYSRLSGIILSSDTETAIINELHGEQCKGKVDIINFEQKIIADIKTTSDELTDESIKRHIYKWDFPIQAAFYCDLAKKEFGIDFTFMFCLVSSKPPYHSRLVICSDQLTPDFMNRGRYKIEEGVTLWKLYKSKSQSFYQSTHIFPDDVPAWY